MAFGAALLGLLKGAGGLIGKGAVAGGQTLLQGGLSNLFGGSQTAPPELLTAEELRETQSRTQGLVDEQVDLSRAMMDPMSQQNQMMRNMMTQRAHETGAQTGRQAMKMAAMRGVSPGQALGAQNQAMNQAMGGVNQQWQAALQDRFRQGLGLMGNMTTHQAKLDQPIGNLLGTNRAIQMATYQPEQAGGGLLDSLDINIDDFGDKFGSGEGVLHGLFSSGEGKGFGSGKGGLANWFGGL